MGYWSIFASVDELDDRCNYEVPMSLPDALAAAAKILPAPDRVIVQSIGDAELTVTTIKHTPAWVIIGWLLPPVGLVLTLTVRSDRSSAIKVRAAESGSVIEARGRLDTQAASRLRSLQAA